MRREFPSLRRAAPARLAALFASALLLSPPAAPPRAQGRKDEQGQKQQQKQQGALERDRARGKEILGIIRGRIEENYYDPNYHGVDLKARFKTAEERIKNAASNGEIFSIIAGLLDGFNDSHLYFIPPNRTARVEYGWLMQMIGDKCYVVDLKRGSDAAKNGLKIGDEVWSIDGYEPTRENLWKIRYSYYTLKPRPGMRVVVQEPGGAQHEVVTLAKLTTAADFFRAARDKKKVPEPPAFRDVGGELFVWKMESFRIDDKALDEMMRRALPFKAMILDLRGNGGGYEKALLRLLGYFFDREVKLGDIKRRKEVKPLVAKPRGAGAYFAGRLVVLIDSNSGSAAELFARTVQLEKRATLLGDRSSGHVMRSRLYGESTFRGSWDFATYSFFAVSVTDADIRMADGGSLEHVGVTPDELLLPTGADLLAGRDPVLSRAAAILGFKLDPQQAGALFPRAARDEEGDDDKDEEDPPDKDKRDK
jgi:carboxyl-terminal processing protease